MISCRDVAHRASDYIDRELSWREWLDVRLHLLMCGACRLYVTQLAATVRLLRGAGHAHDAAPSDDDSSAAARALFRRHRDDPPQPR